MPTALLVPEGSGWASAACRAQAATKAPANVELRKVQVSQTGNMRKSARLRKLYADRRRSCTLFDNLHCKYTAPGPHRSAGGCLPLVQRLSNMYTAEVSFHQAAG